MTIALTLPVNPADWPDPGGLERDQVAVLFDRLREIRQELMERLAVCEKASSDDPAAFIDAMENKVALQHLLNYLRLLQARAKGIEQWEPAGLSAADFADAEGDGRTWVKARALAPLTPDSVLFLHAPVTLWHAAALAEGLLGSGDRLAWLRKAGFHKELASEPLMAVWDAEASPPPGLPERKEAAAEGVFETAQGRRLAFAAWPDPAHPLRRKADYHPMVPEIAAQEPTMDQTGSQFRHRFCRQNWPPAGQEVRGAAAVFALAESLISAFSQGLDDGERLFLFSGLSDRQIPEEFGAWLDQAPEFQIDLSLDRCREVPGRGAFVPGRYRVLPGEEDWTRGVLVRLDSHLMF